MRKLKDKENNYIETMENVADTLRNSELSVSSIVSILEVLKVDIILNSGVVGLDNKPLENGDK